MPEISVTVVSAGETAARTVTTGTKAWELFADDPDVIAARVGGELRDLSRELDDGDRVEPVRIESGDGRDILRHSTAHVMAQAVQELFPEAKLGIGPPIVDGFYYDFAVAEPFKPDDVDRIESRMRKIVKEGQRFDRRVVSDTEARDELADEPYKLELIDIKGAASDDDGSAVEVGAGELTIYDNVRRDGGVAWKDLCRGPHLPTTKRIPAFRLMRTAAAYWRGSEKNPQLQRIYGTAWESKDALDAHVHRLEEAQRRDHRRLGAELDLFSFPDEIGSGLAVFHPKGGMLRKVMEDHARVRHEESGYEFVSTPHITKSALFETSGHLQWYADGMFPPMHVDEERDADGAVRRQGQDYYLKPMNCPMHHLIYRSRGRSYRELPLRLFEFGSVYRYEKSGVVHGLTRVRGMTQDDSHIYCTPEQLQEEIRSLLEFVLSLLADYGLDDFYLELSTRDDDKYVGSDELWAEATAALQQAADVTGLELMLDEGGAAFYAPKISVQARDAIGRTWQLSTIQVDLHMAERFGLEYAAPDGSRRQPYLIHRALFGSIERFIGVLTEHYAGAFPPWLAPVQVVGIPIAERHVDHLHAVAARLRAEGLRVEVDTSDDRMQKKIRTAQTQKVPYMLIAGDRDVEGGAVSFRYLDGEQDNEVPVDDAVARIARAVRDRLPDDAAMTAGDLLQRLWAPHRMAYVTGDDPSSPEPDEQCPFCRIQTGDDSDNLIVARGAVAYAILNLHPYNPGHLMVLPYRHVAEYEDLTIDEAADVALLTQQALRAVRTVSQPHGFNIGLNLGGVAGGSLSEHLHQHVVPRWSGDANFITVVGETKLLPQLLADTRELLASAWPASTR